MKRMRWSFYCLGWFVGAFLTSGLVTAAAERKAGPEMSRGEVRVILLRIGNSVTTNNLPCFEVTYAVEVPKKGAFADLHFGKSEEVTLSVKGVPIKGAQGTSSLATGIENLPRPAELSRPSAQAEKAILGEHVEFTGLKVKEKNIDIVIRFDWRGQKLEFPFKSVPIE
jgi:hypothetical protein